jgi:hypothetical protein
MRRLIRHCDNGIAALTALYGECPDEQYEENCIACRAGRFIRDMRDLRDELRAEAAEIASDATP